MIGPKITVLMSVYNGGRYLKEAIDSILNQSFMDFEFLIINDCSTDTSKEIILSYNDPRIRLIDNEKNIGLTKSLNRGLQLAKGEYVARQDADDVSLPKRLEKEMKTAVEYPQTILISTGFDNFISSFNKNVLIEPSRARDKIEFIEFKDLIKGNSIFHGTVLFKKKDILDINGYDEKFKHAQDYDLWLRISKRGKIIKLKEVLYFRRLHFNSVSMRNIIKQEYFAKLAKKKNLSNEEKVNIKALLSQKYLYRRRAAIRLNRYANIFFKNNKIKEEMFLLTKSLFIWPTVTAFKEIILALLKIIFKFIPKRDNN